MTVKILTSVNLTGTKEIKHTVNKSFQRKSSNFYKAVHCFLTLLIKLGSRFRTHLRHSSGSSEPSPQSSTVSHFHQNGIHLSVLQRNCKRRERRKKDFNNNFFFKQKTKKPKPKPTTYEKLSDCVFVPLIIYVF